MSFSKHRCRYGVRRIVAELLASGIQVGAYQMRKVLQERELKAIQPRRFANRMTDRCYPYPVSPLLL